MTTPNVLFHGSNRSRLEVFSRRPRKTILFTASPRRAYGQALRAKRTWREDAVVVTLTQPELYSPTIRCLRGQFYYIHIRNNPIDLSSEDVVIIEEPTLEKLCEYLPQEQ